MSVCWARTRVSYASISFVSFADDVFPVSAQLFLRLGAAVIATVIVLFAPFVFPGFPASVQQVFIRMFPFGRGLFEDKVANFWCASNVVYKWKRSALHPHLPLISLAITLLGILPTVGHVLYVSWNPAAWSSSEKPTAVKEKEKEKEKQSEDIKKTLVSRSGNSPLISFLFEVTEPSPASTLLPLALYNSSMAFFMFSFQVHEKSILLPLMPFTMLMSAREDLGPSSVGVWEWGMLFNNAAVFRYVAVRLRSHVVGILTSIVS